MVSNKPARDAFRMPTAMKITGRTSTITNAFVNSIIPIVEPSDEEVTEALEILGLDANDLKCAYCGSASTEWDHLRPLVDKKKPTGYISEIRNLVPACGKCNQSKGNKHWKKWIEGGAKLSPTTRRVPELDKKISRLEQYERWGGVNPISLKSLVDSALWDKHESNREHITRIMAQAQETANELKQRILDAYLAQQSAYEPIPHAPHRPPTR